MWNAQANAGLVGYVGIETYGRSVPPILTFTHRYHLLAIGSESRQPVTLDYMARHMLSDLSFDDYLRAGGWRGYAQKTAKNAFVTEARSWLAPLQQMLDAEETRLRALESTTADDLLVVVAIKRQLGTLKRYLKISMDDARHYQAMRARAFRARQQAKTKGIRRTRRRV
jgi:hypothetical protein